MSWTDYDMDPADYESDFVTFSDTTPTARTRHTCDACEGTIQPGEKYRKFVGKQEGQFVIQKYHIGAGRCAEEEKLVAEWQRQQNEIMGDYAHEHHTRSYAALCCRCHGFGAEPHCWDEWEDCRLCGRAGEWDSGEVLPEAFYVETTEPRIPAGLTNIYIPSPPKPRTPPEPRVYGPDETPF